MILKEELAKRKEYVEELLVSYLPEENEYNKKLIQAMSYSLLAGGKRLRPILMQEAYYLSGGTDKSILGFMVAMEMIHNYSLIHDDLPAMDDDDFRRGKPTCHIEYGEDIAVLAGDGLLNRAFEIMLEESLNHGSANGLQAAKEIANAAGANGMIGGQVADVLNEGKEMSLDILNYIHLHKTSALIEASLVAGAYIGDAPAEKIEVFRQIGRNIGFAFQIQDDILDVEGDEKELGKPLNSDFKNNKTTYVTLKGIDVSKEIVKELLDEAIVMTNSIKGNYDTILIDLILSLTDRKK